MRVAMNYNSISKLITILLLVPVLVQDGSSSASVLECREEERAALLQIKAHLSMPRNQLMPEVIQFIPPKYFGYWKGKDCCRWERVTCDPATGHVTKLDLEHDSDTDCYPDIIRPHCDWPNYDSDFLLNASLFLPLRQLSFLSLSGQGISGFIPGAGLEAWYNLIMLKTLDLSYNQLNGSIIYPLASVPSLRKLVMNNNNFGLDGFPINGFESLINLTKLEMLDLSDNGLTTLKFGSDISSLAKVSSLQALYLDSNNFEDTSIHELHALNLKVLSLSDCSISGSFLDSGRWSSLEAFSFQRNFLPDGTFIIPKGLCQLSNLKELDLSYNYFIGNLPLCIGNMSSLRLLDLSFNEFKVKFPSPVLERLISLRYLSLSGNRLEGTLSMKSFLNYSDLQILRLSTQLSSRALYFRPEVLNLPFQLLDLQLANCIIDGEPIFLFSQYKLQSIDLSNTRSKGPAPVSWLLENNSDMFRLDLQKNFFKGYLQLPSLTHEKLLMLDISQNNLEGELPVNIATRLPNLLFLYLSKNYFHGPIPLISSILKVIDLSFNNITDDIRSFSTIMSSFPSYMDLSNNKLHGSFINNMNVTTHAHTMLLLNNNYISGEIPSSICNVSFELLDISENIINGVLPDCIGKATLSALNLSANHLEGPLPLELCAVRCWVVDLSENTFSGSIPPCYNESDLKIVDLSRNHLTGSFPKTWLNISGIFTINIRENDLSGELSFRRIGRESNISVLQAGGNQFKGYIPEDICQFSQLRILDLSENNLVGHIPSCIIDMGKVSYVALYEFSSPTYFIEEKPKTDVNFFLHIEYGFSVDGSALTTVGLEFMSKGRFDIYLNYYIIEVAGVIDLSSNKLEGNIPEKIGQMYSLLTTLNLSNNHFSGGIPNSLSNLSQLESLDLSHNSLTGEIPRDLTKLTSLGSFSVAYNNLSGPILDGNQFNTFDNRSYIGNPNLCGPPLSKSCFPALNTTKKMDGSKNYEGTDYLIFFGSFCLSFVASFWSFIAILYFERNWRYALFNWVDRYGDMIQVRVVLFTRKIGA